MQALCTEQCCLLLFIVVYLLGNTKKFSPHDILEMQREYNTDKDANRNISLVQPKYTIK